MLEIDASILWNKIFLLRGSEIHSMKYSYTHGESWHSRKKRLKRKSEVVFRGGVLRLLKTCL